MADPNFSWIYLIIFLAIPLSRVIPRLIARRKMQNNSTHQRQFELSSDKYKKIHMEDTRPEIKSEKPLTKDRIILRELNHGANTFEKIQKNTGMDVKELDSVLENLERDGLLKVVQKQGLFGPKTELYTTDEGFKEYRS